MKNFPNNRKVEGMIHFFFHALLEHIVRSVVSVLCSILNFIPIDQKFDKQMLFHLF